MQMSYCSRVSCCRSFALSSFSTRIHEPSDGLRFWRGARISDDGHRRIRGSMRSPRSPNGRETRRRAESQFHRVGNPKAIPNKSHAARNACRDRRKNMVEITDTMQGVVLLGLVALFTGLVVLLKGLYLIRAGEVGVLVKRLRGRKMPPRQGNTRHSGNRTH